MAMHGMNKFVGSGGIAGVAQWFDGIGMRPGRPNAIVAATTETAAGVALAVGLCTPVAAAAFVALMLVAVYTVHRHNGFFETTNGWEYNLVLAGSTAAVALMGPGKYSVDWLIFQGTDIEAALSGWDALVFAVGLGVLAGVGQLLACFRPKPAAKSAT